MAAKPVADVIGIAVREGNSHSLVKEILEILTEVGEDKVSCVLELVVDVAVGSRVIQVDADGVLHMRLVEVRSQVRRRCRVITGVTNVVGSTTGEA